jgi:hypothetical protein
MLGGKHLFAGLRPAVVFPKGNASSSPANGKLLGILVDAARQPATMDQYHRIIDFCQDWGLNTLQFRLADDQGSVLRFSSVPNLITHRHAFTATELKGLVEYGRSRGVQLVPEVESFGHTGYITRSPAYAHLIDRDKDSQTPSSFTGVIPVAPETLSIFSKLYAEIADIFPSRYLHGGCDEVGWGGSALSRKALQKKSRAQVWAQYVNALNKICNDLGKEMIVWGDVVLNKLPDTLGMLNKNIVIMDWNYWETDAVKIQQPLLKVAANGFRGMGAPALAWSGWGPRVGEKQLRNIDAYTDAYLGSDNPAVVGAIVTNWVPTNYVENSIWDGWAYSAIAFNEGVTAAQSKGFQKFVEKHYNAQWNDTWEEIFDIIYREAPVRRRQPDQSSTGLTLPVPWSSDEQLRDVLRQGAAPRNPFIRLLSQLVLVEPAVSRNLPDFHSFRLSVEYLERLFWREAIAIEQLADKPLNREKCDSLIQIIAQRDRDLHLALSKNWDRGRPADSEGRLQPVFDLGPEAQLLYQWGVASEYSASLAAQPQRFYDLLTTAGIPAMDRT